ncbi:hypothetical protein BHE74_00037229 [Ensete ventricosum]|uniref:Uncharacterized protein n=1 Tax=Ensete ventricosum TaxID=4639 RepID=A0A444E7V7_ENSVE|nr:hypothetical protein GW17_00030198 [Ensete ventricosum]RWW56085.1 hypothetical protein BHE74_00037229 [Ensete ventricosum]RZR74864.1 hypothetical protein BHM03_00045024 [Ensete ventricosum]
MSTKVFSFLLLFLALAVGNTSLFPCAAADGTRKAVEGMVYCQKCKYVGSWNLDGARPLPSAKVSIICKDHKHRVIFYDSAEADKNGYFYKLLDGTHLRSATFDPVTACTVRLLASPDANCNRLTNVNYGIQGAKLRDENKTYSDEHCETKLYAAGPLAFKPVHCHPRTHY